MSFYQKVSVKTQNSLEAVHGMQQGMSDYVKKFQTIKMSLVFFFFFPKQPDWSNDQFLSFCKTK